MRADARASTRASCFGHGNPKALKTNRTPTYAHVDSKTGSCTFTPKKAGKFAFSVLEEGATEAAYSALVNITPAPASEVVTAKPTKDTAASSEKEPAPEAAKGPVPASPQGPAPVPASKAPQPMAMKPEAKMVPSSSSKAEAARKANAKRALYDIAAFAM
ncbi:hypothetical protein BG006_001417 [Podila minutissima]|uniref:Uncharacterized protein n=1 Tax=Podila minutissima TaxID=64525 RepID=A0A9P5VP25_9FUNG|nr:hypothetical protein BG006_001417 [Podila minutissima]